jgi:dipeptidyl-peptidase-4
MFKLIKHWSFCTIILGVTHAYAQSGQNVKGLLPLPHLTKWTDASHFLLNKYDQETRKTQIFKVDVKTGQEKLIPETGYGALLGKMLREKDNDIYLFSGKQHERLTNSPEVEEFNPEFSPDSNYVAFSRQHDLYVLDLKTKKETRLTNDGSSTILNGYASWVYMEEILGRATAYRAFWWSPDSKQLAFFRTDEANVPLFTITDAGADHGIVKTQRYPQPGDPNPEVKVGVANIETGKTAWASIDEKADQYFGTPYWQPDSKALLVQWLNRKQQDYKIYKVNPLNGKKETAYEEHQDTWINLDEDDRLTFLGNSNDFLLVSDKSGYRQLYIYNTAAKKMSTVTEGTFVVKSVSYVDFKNKVIYFIANKEHPNHDDLYRVNLNGKGLKRLTFGPYNHQVTLSPDGQYFITKYSNAGTPDQLALLNNTGKLIKVLGDSKGPDLDISQAPRKDELITVKSEDGKFDLPVRISYPRNMVPGKKYPLMVVIYGGPASTDVNDNFSSSMLRADTVQSIYAYMDHRGAYEFGKVGQNYMYKQLGHWEIADWSQIVKWLIQNKHVDADKVMISGFSYGGYITCYALANAPDVFKYGMAGGSVTDWKYYDSHYTERFMGTPADNPDGYKNSSVLTNIKNLKGRLLLVHGMADDNVHVMNTLQLAAKLEELNKTFEMMLYPGNTHNMIGPKLNHYNSSMNDFRSRVIFDKVNK